MSKKIVIVDDSRLDIEHLSAVLESYFEKWEIAAVFEHPIQALEYVQSNPVDLLFLDVKMEEMSGLELADRLKHKNIPIIFVTQYEAYAVQAFEVSALDYLVKPISAERLSVALQKFDRHFGNTSTALQLDVLHETIQKLRAENVPFSRIMINNQHTVELVMLDDLLFCEAKGPYTNFHKKDGKTILATKPLKYFEAILGNHGFFRMHRSNMVNIAAVELIDKSNMVVRLQSGLELPISPDRLSQFIERFRLHMEKNMKGMDIY